MYLANSQLLDKVGLNWAEVLSIEVGPYMINGR